MKVLALNFTAPLQSWAGRVVVKTNIDTKKQPPERAIRGLIAAAYGVPRTPHGQPYPDNIEELKIEIIELSPGHVQSDFQTIGDRSEDGPYFDRIGRLLSSSKKSPPALLATPNATTVINRTYLSEASFLVLVKGASDLDTETTFERLKEPVYSPYLGKKAFPPTFPFVLGVFEEEEAIEQSRAIIMRVKDLLYG